MPRKTGKPGTDMFGNGFDVFHHAGYIPENMMIDFLKDIIRLMVFRFHQECIVDMSFSVRCDRCN
jgi:hypothetical protein